MTAANELRQAAAKVRCDHHFQWTETRPGVRRRAGVCKHCGIEWDRRDVVADELAEPLAAWLEKTADTHRKHEADGATWCRYCAETWPCGDTKHAREVARAINGGAS